MNYLSTDLDAINAVLEKLATQSVARNDFPEIPDEQWSRIKLLFDQENTVKALNDPEDILTPTKNAKDHFRSGYYTKKFISTQNKQEKENLDREKLQLDISALKRQKWMVWVALAISIVSFAMSVYLFVINSLCA